MNGAADRRARLAAALGTIRRSRMARSAFGLGGLTVVEMAFGLVTAILLARELGLEGFGIYSLVLATIAIVGLPVGFGLPGLVTREVAHAGAAADEGVAKGVIVFAVTVIALMTAILLSLVYLADATALLGLDEAERAIAPLAVLIIPVNALKGTLGAALTGRQRIVLGALPERLVRPGAFAFTIAAVVLIEPGWLTPVRAVALQLLATGLALAVAGALFARHFRGCFRAAPARISWRRWIVAILQLGASSGMIKAHPQLLLMLIGALGSLEAVGLFRVAQRGAGLVGAASAIPTTVAGPRFASLHSRNERARLQRLITIVARTSCAAALAGLAGYLLAGPWLLDMLFGAEFLAAWGALIVLTANHAVCVFFGPGVMLMNMLRQEGVTMRGFILSRALSLAAALALIPPLGALGAALANLAGSVSMAVFLRSQARRRFGLDPAASVPLAPAG